MKSSLFPRLVLSGFLFAASIESKYSALAADDYRVTWDTPGQGCKDSMPIGNGDLGMNFWTEQNGEVVFLISKGDAWSENSQLVKLGRVRVKFESSPFIKGASFKQVLKPRDGQIEVRGESGAVLLAWVDANAPAIHLEFSGPRPVAAQASVELWRTEPRRTNCAKGNTEMERGFREYNGTPEGGLTIDPDTVLPAKSNQLTWLHHNSRSVYPDLLRNQHLEPLASKYPDPLLNRNFGAGMKGEGFVSVDNQTLKTAQPKSKWRLEVVAFSNQSAHIADWQKGLAQTVARVDAMNLEAARKATLQWWDQFWDRSWIKVSGDEGAEQATQGYAMQRWMTACSGRAQQPIKFNGGIFSVAQEPPAGTPYDPNKGEITPDYRAWGSNYWFQNSRLLYWPMIANGDFDTLAPFFKMYRQALPLATDRTKLAFKHDGAIFPETIYFWGLPNNNDYGWGNKGPDMTNRWVRRHFNNALEMITMMLDSYQVTQDADFAKNTLVPLASAFTVWFDQHWPRVDGKLHFEPSEALETRQNASNPLPDIAGLKHVLPRLIDLPPQFTTETQRSLWKKMLADLPPLPRGRTDAEGKSPLTSDTASPTGKKILWPAEKFDRPNNVENPELYAVHPYRLYGFNLPDLELARDTYEAKRFVDSTCWGQQGIQAACLGWADRAKKEVIANFTAFGSERFKWFWKPGHDWEPDLDNGGAGQIILQSMLIQPRGDKILLFPAWPKEWDVEFKLHASGNTVIEGSYHKGEGVTLKVTPSSRTRDVIQLSPQ